MTQKKPVTQHKTSKLILYTDKIAHVVITVGGLATIAAVLMVCCFLIYIAWPLFSSTSSQVEKAMPLASVHQVGDVDTVPRYVAMDDDKRLLWSLSKQGFLELYDVRSEKRISQQDLFENEKPTALMMSTAHNMVIGGFADGSIQMTHISFIYTFLEKTAIEASYHDMVEGELRTYGEGVVFKTPSKQWRHTTLNIIRDAPLHIEGTDVAIEHIDFTMSTDGPVIATYDSKHRVALHRVVEKNNLMTMTTTTRLETTSIPYSYREQQGLPKDMLLIGQGEYLLLLWENGYSERYNALDEEAFLAEKSRLADDSLFITSVGRFLGRSTVLLGYSDGSVAAWFLTEPEESETKDGRMWQAGHRFEGNENHAAVRTIDSSRRQRLALFTYADGSARMLHVTSERVIYDGIGVDSPICAAISPRDDGLILCGAKDIQMISIDAEHPDVTVASLFLPVWYESASQAETVWQSSSASDDAEAKLGLWPLIFGTFKATFYSLLFGVPIALAAAIYSSEYLHHATKRKVKPCIEMMASLPSVVLGFLGGLIIAMWMKAYVVDVLTAIFIGPMCVSGAAYCIQMLPRKHMVLAMRYRLYIIAGPCMVVAYFITRFIADIAENALFAGDFIAWLAGSGDSFGGTWYICLPISIVAVLMAVNHWGKPALIEKMRGTSHLRCAVVDFIKYMCTCVLVVLCAFVLAYIFETIGVTVRGSGNIFDIYETRNALVVGFMMAFAIIPIIYTIADDALSAVPNHLRAASLGAGATPWQTAMRIVVPTAMSGLFSAVMVGLGRAIGETMIVLMVAGNTPIQDLNIFNGMKTLSANIASELPESVMGSTHYRTLFLSALVLFVLTFILNTGVEYLRGRFRKQGASL